MAVKKSSPWSNSSPDWLDIGRSLPAFLPICNTILRLATG